MPLSRHEVALVILSLANGEPFTPVQIQKALFLASDKARDAFRPDSHYNFQPYDYGPFDWQVYADVEMLERHGLAQIGLNPDGRWKTYAATGSGIAAAQRFSERLTPNQIEMLRRIVRLVRSLSFTELVSSIYRGYPEMQVRSVFRE
jgi:uncharacterized protein